MTAQSTSKPSASSQTPAVIDAAVRQLRSQFLRENRADSYFAINDGYCEDFADELLSSLGGIGEPGDSMAMVVETDNFRVTDSDGIWDQALLRKHWGISEAPTGFTWDELNRIDFGYHVWLTAEGRHYDAECPEGVANFFELPLFRRYLITAGRKKGLPLADVVTDDVIPAPLCPVPMPD